MAKFSIVIHTEEEFDWSGGFNRKNTDVTHGAELTNMCENMLALGCKITFAMDWSFVTSEQGLRCIKHMQTQHAEKVEFATHLHPWVNPPFDEQDTSVDSQSANIKEVLSYPGNLDAELEKAKLENLSDRIELVTSYKPTTYLAGRYGVGENTYKILDELNYKVDVSISPFADFTHQFGPDFSSFTNTSRVQNNIDCIPHSTGYISRIKGLSDWLNKDAAHLNKLNNNVFGKVVLKLLGVERVRLSPEGFSAKQMLKLADSLTRVGVEHLIYSFHSSTSKLGGSPYVNTQAMLDAFHDNNLNALAELCKNYQPVLVNEHNA